MILLTIAIITITFISYKTWSFKHIYNKSATEGIIRTSQLRTEILSESDILNLPLPIKNYLRYVGAINKEKVKNFRVVFKGLMRDQKKPSFKVNVKQFNFFDIPTRLFYMTGKVKILPVAALHIYKNNHATFSVKALSTFSIIDEKEGNLNIAETVTFFNDMCLLAPASLIDKRIEWQDIDSLNVKATFTNNNISISANLKFNETGQLISFCSDDRYYYAGEKRMQKVRWTTPVISYKDFEGYRIASIVKAIWSLPESDFCYAKFELKKIEYNCKE